MFLNALLVLTKIYICCVTDVSKQERDMDMKPVLGKLYQSVIQAVELRTGLEWPLRNYSVFSDDHFVSLGSSVSGCPDLLILLMRMAQPVGFLDSVCITVRVDQNYHLAELLVFSLFFIYFAHF